MTDPAVPPTVIAAPDATEYEASSVFVERFLVSNSHVTTNVFVGSPLMSLKPPRVVTSGVRPVASSSTSFVNVPRLMVPVIRGWTLYPLKVPNCKVWPGMTAIEPPDLFVGGSNQT